MSNDCTHDKKGSDPNEIVITRRRGCIIRMIGAWLLIGLFLILGVLFVRSKVVRDPNQIADFVQTRFEMSLPEGFYPYSMNKFWGSTAIAFWDELHVREDGRTFNLLSLYREDDWAQRTVAEVESSILGNLDDQLARLEFHPTDRRIERMNVAGEQVTVHVFSGEANLDGDLVLSSTCFRFIASKDGPVQLQTIGLDDSFPVAVQLQILTSFKAVQ